MQRGKKRSGESLGGPEILSGQRECVKMRVVYIHHSGYYVDTGRIQLLMDYSEGSLEMIRTDRPLAVFVSHSHGDHFSRRIFDLKARVPQISFFLSSDIPKRTVPAESRAAAHFLGPDEEYRSAAADGLSLSVRTLRSNDLGAAFVIHVDGRSLYFAGDLNNWYWDGDDEDRKLADFYHIELAKIRGQRFDLAFIPVDPRLRNPYLGVTDFMNAAQAAVIFPMHMWGDYGIVRKLKQQPETAAYRDRIMEVPGDGAEWEV